MSPDDDPPIAAVQAIQIATLRRVLGVAFELLDPKQREELDLVLRSDVLDIFGQLGYQPLTHMKRALAAFSIEELVLVRNMLTVGVDAGDAAVGE